MSRPGRCLNLCVLSLLCAVACGGDPTEGAPPPTRPVSPSPDPQGPATVATEEPAVAGDLSPTPAPAPPTPETTSVATEPAQLVLLHTHELLRSEERQVEQLRSVLGRAHVTLERVAAGDRRVALEAWLDESDPAERAQMALGAARGAARAVLVLRFAPPVENRAQGVVGFGVIAGEPPQERLWAHGDLPAAARVGMAAFFPAGGAP